MSSLSKLLLCFEPEGQGRACCSMSNRMVPRICLFEYKKVEQPNIFLIMGQQVSVRLNDSWFNLSQKKMYSCMSLYMRWPLRNFYTFNYLVDSMVCKKPEESDILPCPTLFGYSEFWTWRTWPWNRPDLTRPDPNFGYFWYSRVTRTLWTIFFFYYYFL